MFNNVYVLCIKFSSDPIQGINQYLAPEKFASLISLALAHCSKRIISANDGVELVVLTDLVGANWGKARVVV